MFSDLIEYSESPFYSRKQSEERSTQILKMSNHDKVHISKGLGGAEREIDNFSIACSVRV